MQKIFDALKWVAIGLPMMDGLKDSANASLMFSTLVAIGLPMMDGLKVQQATR